MEKEGNRRDVGVVAWRFPLFVGTDAWAVIEEPARVSSGRGHLSARRARAVDKTGRFVLDSLGPRVVGGVARNFFLACGN